MKRTSGRPLSAGPPRGDRVSPPGRRIGNPAPRFCFLFLLFLAIFMALSATPPAERFVHEPLSRLQTLLAAPILSPLGPVSVSGNSLLFNSFSASVEEACDGVLPTCVFVAAVLAFPAPVKQKIRGIVLGAVAVFLINLLRVVTLMLVGSYWPDLFERVHIYVWQALVIALAMALWVFWVEHVVRRGAPEGS